MQSFSQHEKILNLITSSEGCIPMLTQRQQRQVAPALAVEPLESVDTPPVESPAERQVPFGRAGHDGSNRGGSYRVIGS